MFRARTVVRKWARAQRIESTWVVSKTPAVRQSPATNKGVLLGEQAYILPLSLIPQKGKLKSPKLGRAPLGPVRIHCASACCRNRLIMLWPIPVLTKRSKRKAMKGEKMYKENKGVVFFVLRHHWAKGRLNRERTQWERMCSNFPIKEQWMRPHAECLADVRELDSLIKCYAVVRLPALTKLDLWIHRSLIVQGGLIKNCNACKGSLTTSTLKAQKSHKVPIQWHYQTTDFFLYGHLPAKHWFIRWNGNNNLFLLFHPLISLLHTFSSFWLVETITAQYVQLSKSFQLTLSLIFLDKNK